MAANDPGKNIRHADQLRTEIDSGRTGDKVPFPDPAAVPLSADEEAAGTPPPAEAVARAAEHERHRPAHKPPRSGPGHAWILIAVIVLAALGLLALLASR
jgi:hypothetical protein